MAIPFIVLSLLFAAFYLPADLPAAFWSTMIAYVFFGAIDVFCYFKAISLADISFVAPLLSLVAVGNIIGAYFILGQKPTIFGLGGAVLIVLGAYVTNKAKSKDKETRVNNKLAVLFVLILVVTRAIISNIEVNMLRVSNPTTFNFYSSVLTIPVLLITAKLLHRRKKQIGRYRSVVRANIRAHWWALLFIGITYTINMLATYQAKLIGPNAGYVGAVKSAQVLPMVLIGAFLFQEKIVRQQWLGLVLIIVGLAGLGIH
jgi:drug/metabolite transporter (DMT)-like permease